MHLSELPKPFICTVIAESDIRSAIARIEEAEAETDAFEVNAAPLDIREMAQVFASTRKPCIATNRRANFMRVYGFTSLQRIPENQRKQRLIKCIDGGARAVDFELDMFDEQPNKLVPGSREEQAYSSRKDSKPTEITYDHEAVEQQRKLAEEIKSLGAEAIISCHCQTRFDRKMVFHIAGLIQNRGADFAKIVIATNTAGDLERFLKCTLDLTSWLRIPFNLMNMGEDMILGRTLSAGFGSSWLYCRSKSERSFAGQPTVDEALKILRSRRK